MTGAAEAVTALPGAVGQLVDDLPVPEHRQRAVDGREPHALAALAQARVDLLGGGVVGLGRESLEDE